MILQFNVGDQLGAWVFDHFLVFSEPALLACHHVDDPTLKATLEVWEDKGLARTRLNRRITALQSFDHHAIPRLIEHGDDDGRLFIAMRPFSGDSLSDRMMGGSFGWSEGCAWLYRVAQALQHIHSMGWVHRGVNPQAIYVGDGDEAWLLGMASALRVDEVPNSEIPSGNISYVAPEVLADQGHDPIKADVYSFGCVAYELLRGEPAFPAAAWAENADRDRMMVDWKTRAAALDPGPQHPDWLRSLVRNCAHPDAAKRLPDVDAIVNWLEGSLGSWQIAESAPSQTPGILLPRQQLPPLHVQPAMWDPEDFAEAVAARAAEMQEPENRDDVFYAVSVAMGMAAGLAASVLTVLFVELALLA